MNVLLRWTVRATSWLVRLFRGNVQCQHIKVKLWFQRVLACMYCCHTHSCANARPIAVHVASTKHQDLACERMLDWLASHWLLLYVRQ